MGLAAFARWLRPDLLVNSLEEIPLGRLQQRGIRAFILDLDNTVTFWQSDTVAEATRAWLRQVRELGFAVCLSSNNSYARGAPVAACLGLPLVPSAGKPRRRAFYQALDILGTGPQETAVIGDQIFTDVFGAKRLGMFCILVRPLGPREFITTRLLRHLERLVIRCWESG